MAREVRVAILGDSRDFARAVSSAQRDASRLEGAFGKVGGGIARLGKAVAFGAAGVAVGAAALGKGFVDAAIESQKVTAQTDAVIKSMGGAAKVTAAQVADLSTQLSLKSGIDDELIQSGANVMLTFAQIRNEVGKGNNIFDRANAAALDLSVALGTDMKSASMQVGKALNDPVRGLTQLRRSGIQFTKQQEDQIKAMVEAGDVAGAQKVMLAELERQFGGSAAAQATATDKLKVAWGNLQEQLGEKLLPVVEKVATWLAANLPSAMAKAEAAFDRIRPVVERVIAMVRDNWPQIEATIRTVAENLRVVIEGFVSVATTLWNNFGNNILEFVQRVWPRIQQVIGGALEIIRGIIQTITSLIKGDWSGVWEGIKGIVSGAWHAIQGIVGGALEAVRSAIGVGLEVIGSMFRGAWDGIVGWMASLPGRLGRAAQAAWNALKQGLSAAIDFIIRQIDRALGPLDELLAKAATAKDILVGGVPQPKDRNGDGIPEFAQGGIVPGSLGQPRLILAHGGEQVVTHGQQMRSGGAVAFPSSVTLVIDGQQFTAKVYAAGKAQASRRGVAA